MPLPARTLSTCGFSLGLRTKHRTGTVYGVRCDVRVERQESRQRASWRKPPLIGRPRPTRSPAQPRPDRMSCARASARGTPDIQGVVGGVEVAHGSDDCEGDCPGVERTTSGAPSDPATAPGDQISAPLTRLRRCHLEQMKCRLTCGFVGAPPGTRTLNPRIKSLLPIVYRVRSSALTCGSVGARVHRVHPVRPSTPEISGRISGRQTLNDPRSLSVMTPPEPGRAIDVRRSNLTSRQCSAAPPS